MNKLEMARAMDEKDVLREFRKQFVSPSDQIYLDGNSLGKLPIKTKTIVQEVVDTQWGQTLIGGWNAHWLELPQRLGDKLARLLCAPPKSIHVGDATSVNLYKLVYALRATNQYGPHLITDALNFPTDNYILQGIAQQFNAPPVVKVVYENEVVPSIEQLKAAIAATPGIVCLSLVSYKSAYLYTMELLNRWAEQHKSIIVWDLSHAVGAVAIDLQKSQTKAAVGCTYKYLNGGPGSPSFLYADPAIVSSLQSPIKGWFGHRNPFDFSPNYLPAEGVDQFKAGTPAILSLSAMEPGVDITLDAGIDNIRAKGLALGEYFLDLVYEKLTGVGFRIESPTEAASRGSHITLSHEESWRICKALLAGDEHGLKIIPDFRPPNFIRFGFAPLYTGFEDLYVTAERLHTIVEEKQFTAYDATQTGVT